MARRIVAAAGGHPCSMKIGLLGDVMLGRGVTEALATTPAEELWAPEVRAVATECELLVCNLECCISERGAPTELVPGKPFFFRAPPRAVGALRAVGARAASLANNHPARSAEARDEGLHARTRGPRARPRGRRTCEPLAR